MKKELQELGKMLKVWWKDTEMLWFEWWEKVKK